MNIAFADMAMNIYLIYCLFVMNIAFSDVAINIICSELFIYICIVNHEYSLW